MVFELPELVVLEEPGDAVDVLDDVPVITDVVAVGVKTPPLTS